MPKMYVVNVPLTISEITRNGSIVATSLMKSKRGSKVKHQTIYDL